LHKSLNLGNNKSKINIETQISSDDIIKQLGNNPTICFEVTEKCNLNCRYCAYGEFYDGYNPRDGSDLAVEMGKKVVDQIVSSFNLRVGDNRCVHISFYGGEPLLRFDFIKQIVDHCSNYRKENILFSYSMTTNGVLLNRYQNFLKENNFNLLISLDGNEINNSFRNFKNGKPSFNLVYNNANELKNKYPDYFNNYVSFNSVLHKKNNVSDTVTYIYKNFGIVPGINYVSYDGVRKDKINEFKKTFDNDDYVPLKREKCDKGMYLNYELETPEFQEAIYLIRNLTNHFYTSYIDLLTYSIKTRLHTATCIPFMKKVFITSKGVILPCENVPHVNNLGKTSCNGLEIDFGQIADNFSKDLTKMLQTCRNCYNLYSCDMCLFQRKNADGSFDFSCFHTKKKMEKKFTEIFTYLEQNDNAFQRIINEISLL